MLEFLISLYWNVYVCQSDWTISLSFIFHFRHLWNDVNLLEYKYFPLFNMFALMFMVVVFTFQKETSQRRCRLARLGSLHSWTTSETSTMLAGSVWGSLISPPSPRLISLWVITLLPQLLVKNIFSTFFRSPLTKWKPFFHHLLILVFRNSTRIFFLS